MRLAILASIAISQIGFVTGTSPSAQNHDTADDMVTAYIIFIAENLQAFILAVTDCRTFISTPTLIFAELVLFLPLAMIRDITKLSGTALVADAFILIGCEWPNLLSNDGADGADTDDSGLYRRKRDFSSGQTRYRNRCGALQFSVFPSTYRDRRLCL